MHASCKPFNLLSEKRFYDSVQYETNAVGDFLRIWVMTLLFEKLELGRCPESLRETFFWKIFSERIYYNIFKNLLSDLPVVTVV